MIYTVTFNPAIDCVMHADDVSIGSINRSRTQEFYFGGKGVNVSYVLSYLGRPSIAWGFVAGWTGEALEDALARDGIASGFVHLPAGNTRVNVKLKGHVEGAGERETAVNAPGPPVDGASLEAFFDQLADVRAGDVLVLSGGIPSGMDETVYARIMKRVAASSADVVVDATGDLLMNTLPLHPLLVKPNDEEIAEIMGAGFDASSESDLERGARRMHDLGARNVLISRGGDGALLIDEAGELHRADAHAGELVNSVGAGDSTVAGFVEGTLRALELGLSGSDAVEYAFHLALACGSATAFSPGLAPIEKVRELFSRAGYAQGGSLS